MSVSSGTVSPSEHHSVTSDADLGDEAVSVLKSLSCPEPSISSKYFYDERGSNLFDQICDLDEYYPTRTEAEIMVGSIGRICELIPGGSRLIEYGSGSSLKTRVLLKSVDPGVRYLPVDISGDYLHSTADRLRSEFPGRSIQPIVADFTAEFSLPKKRREDEVDILYFPGSTIGNFTRQQSMHLLRRMSDRAGPNGRLLIGFDLQKDRRTLLAAYDDVFGITAEFNLNSLYHLNRVVGTNFNAGQFQHFVQYNEEHHRVEMYLRAVSEQVVRIGQREILFPANQLIRTEYSHKYTLHGFSEIAKNCGWKMLDCWTDERKFFAVAMFETCRQATGE